MEEDGGKSGAWGVKTGRKRSINKHTCLSSTQEGHGWGYFSGMAHWDYMRAWSIDVLSAHLGSTVLCDRQNDSSFAPRDVIGYHMPRCFSETPTVCDIFHRLGSANISQPKACHMTEPRCDRQKAALWLGMGSCCFANTMRRAWQGSCCPRTAPCGMDRNRQLSKEPHVAELPCTPGLDQAAGKEPRNNDSTALQTLQNLEMFVMHQNSLIQSVVISVLLLFF